MGAMILRAVIVGGLALALAVAISLAGASGGARIDLPAFGHVPVLTVAMVLAVLVQWVAFIPSVALRTERHFDLTGSLTYIGITAVLLLTTPGLDARGILVGVLVIAWAMRLGTFLFVRISKAGKDGRFDEILASPGRLFGVWSIQGLWVGITALAAWIAMTSTRDASMGWLTLVGVAVWLVGMAIEVTADAQKSAFRRDPANRDRFIRTGLWSWSRHPNYFGEITLWVGVFLIAVPVLTGWQWIAVLSPLFVVVLLTKVSGIPRLEDRADKRWGGQGDYEEYKAHTPVLVPMPPRKR